MSTLNAHGHEFSFDDPAALLYRGPGGHELRFPYDDNLRFRAGFFGGDSRVRSARCSASLAPLSREQLGDFLSRFFAAWNARAPEAARKAAFDYVDGQRGFTKIALFGSAISAFVAIGLLADSHQNFTCTRELEAHAVPGEIRVVKATKKDSRSFKIKMEFTAPNGELIKGEDLVRTKNEKDIPKTLPIQYSPERPLCWSLTKGLDSGEVDWAKRRYFAWFTLLFGLFFVGCALLGMGWCATRMVKGRPFAEELNAQFGFK